MAAPLPPPPPSPGRPPQPRVTLIERGATVWMYGLGAVCLLAVWLTEAAMGQIAVQNRVAYPVLMTVFVTLGLWVWRCPERLAIAQGLGTLTLNLYFVMTLGYGLLVAHTYSLYQAGSLAYWLMGGHLMFFITWPPRQALALSAGLITLTFLPAVWITLGGLGTDEWHDTLWPIHVNGLVAQSFLALALFGATRQLRKLTVLAPHTEVPAGQPLTVNDVVTLRMRDLEQSRDAAEAASQAKSRFLAVMSHELRTPLHGVLGAADLLRQPDLPLAQRRELVDTVHRGGTHLLHLINDVLDLSRIEAGRLDLLTEPFDLHDCLGRALESVAMQAQARGLVLRPQIEPNVPRWLSGDDFRLRQVLINLLSNAVKFTDHGEVTLHARYDTPARDLVLRVVDTGIGISDVDRLRVFDAFHQADSGSTRRHGGTGLGLAITRQIVSMMGGRIALSSQLGRGTEVTLHLPLPPGEPPTGLARPSVRGELGADLAGVRVLLVDDDTVNTLIAEQMLGGLNAQVHTAHTGLEALDRLRHGGYDIVLMDWRMPEMDGLEATRRLRAGAAGDTARALPVIGLTANAYAEDRNTCLAAGMNDVLVKPVAQHELMRAILTQLKSAA